MFSSSPASLVSSVISSRTLNDVKLQAPASFMQGKKLDISSLFFFALTSQQHLSWSASYNRKHSLSSTMAEAEAPAVSYEDLALIEDEFEEVDSEISTSLY